MSDVRPSSLSTNRPLTKLRTFTEPPVRVGCQLADQTAVTAPCQRIRLRTSDSFVLIHLRNGIRCVTSDLSLQFPSTGGGVDTESNEARDLRRRPERLRDDIDADCARCLRGAIG